VSKALHRITRAAEAGLRTWRERGDASAEKKRDGAVVDALENFSKALGKALRVASRAPSDAAEAMPKVKVRRLLRRAFR
jgi:hypothetical protein